MLELCQILTDFKNSFAVEVLAASARKRSRRLRRLLLFPQLIFRSRAPVSMSRKRLLHILSLYLEFRYCFVN